MESHSFLRASTSLRAEQESPEPELCRRDADQHIAGAAEPDRVSPHRGAVVVRPLACFEVERVRVQRADDFAAAAKGRRR